MLGIDYPSSDEDEAAPDSKSELINIANANANAPATKTPPKPVPIPQVPAASAPISGPSQGPTVSPPPTDDNGPDHAAPSNTSTRAVIQNLTLPTVPKFDIPASPPGSPPLKATKKFTQFLDLKQKGQHFNQRLEGSSVLRDPGHLQRLMDFASISEEDSYATTLSDEVAIPVAFPKWAYVEELRASQKGILKAREQGKNRVPRDAVEFVSATKSGTSSGTGTPAGKGTQQQSSAERVMGSIDKEAPNLSSSQTTSKRKQLEYRCRDESSVRNGWNGRPRSPKRRRSRSRDGRG
ncbi:hypothetical protein LEMA_P063250.1 [Plenodomus lingam JN3]|uniref:HCNGP-like protein n=1 Tax=Leptosphaeria maculans (strain JN3 / isolate v23.1.3 / race Av1-4-5-6-7-8) TaxID=985895 RepID=E4ZFX9_LEPMJ|nr:hypothetical protein LEMA_P063250.1 [Plenodomus lingam JN3]CBX90199.1 hypothetical protein LEMA_P063250.1 [Plenodomus lingam JN3]